MPAYNYAARGAPRIVAAASIDRTDGRTPGRYIDSVSLEFLETGSVTSFFTVKILSRHLQPHVTATHSATV